MPKKNGTQETEQQFTEVGLTEEEWKKAGEKLAKAQKKLEAHKAEASLMRRSLTEKLHDLENDVSVLAEQVDSRTKKVPAQRRLFEGD